MKGRGRSDCNGNQQNYTNYRNVYILILTNDLFKDGNLDYDAFMRVAAVKFIRCLFRTSIINIHGIIIAYYYKAYEDSTIPTLIDYLMAFCNLFSCFFYFDVFLSR